MKDNGVDKFIKYFSLLFIIIVTVYLAQETLHDPNYVFKQFEGIFFFYALFIAAFASTSKKLLFIRDLFIGGILTEEEKKSLKPFDITLIFWGKYIMIFLISTILQFILSKKIPSIGILLPILSLVGVIIFFNAIDRIVNKLFPKSTPISRGVIEIAIAFLLIILFAFFLDFFKVLQ